MLAKMISSSTASRRISKIIVSSGERTFLFGQTRSISMATPYKIQVPVTNTGLWKFRQQDDTANKVSELLQEDLKKHHVFFNQDGFHNHIPHHVLALYGTGAGPDAIQMAYNENKNYQRPAKESHESVADELHSWEYTKKYRGREKHYSDFLLFYQREIERLGWEAALNEHLFKGDERANDMFQRMFAGFLHPIIQLMYGVEWEQPAIVAEGLAQAAVHKNQLKTFFDEAERRAGETAETPMPQIAALIEEIRGDRKLATAAEMGDANKVFDGVMKRAPEEMLRIASKVKVLPEELDERTAEMFHTAFYVAGGAALRPGKEAKWDFFLIHHTNAAPIFLSFNSKSWISAEIKVRMLEHKIRMDLVQYAARGCPEPRLDQIRSYRPRDRDQGKELVSKPSGDNPPPGCARWPTGTDTNWATDLLPRFHSIPDDGHTIKVARALGICHELSSKYGDKPWIKIKGDYDWLKLVYMLLDGTEHSGTRWVRSAGFEEAWKDIPARD
ncbi:Oxidoreductase AflY [Colletotrichum tanaceti]|uniref:Oxidoreductase AflY n=1 Tax=Colletotrichum tanaceti TaxID=1306861 RepID=A0A4U6XNK6_9PEZI|nr:Oxidoreductase AflY [Colletotrichum tanaceti]TKW57345.1 Oxidoreductase AflY [Colletotrichum tanaceti]